MEFLSGRLLYVGILSLHYKYNLNLRAIHEVKHLIEISILWNNLCTHGPPKNTVSLLLEDVLQLIHYIRDLQGHRLLLLSLRHHRLQLLYQELLLGLQFVSFLLQRLYPLQLLLVLELLLKDQFL